jgi:hypothetical protein
MQLELELGGDRNGAPAPKRPEGVAVEQIGSIFSRAADLTSTVDIYDRAQRGRGQAERPHEPADAAAKRVAGDADGWRRAAQTEQPVRFGGLLNARPDGAGAGAGDGRPAVDTHERELRHVDEERVVSDRAARAVAGGLDDDREAKITRGADRFGDVFCGAWPYHRHRLLREARVLRPRGRVVLVAARREDNRWTECSFESKERCHCLPPAFG